MGMQKYKNFITYQIFEHLFLKKNAISLIIKMKKFKLYSKQIIEFLKKHEIQ